MLSIQSTETANERLQDQYEELADVITTLETMIDIGLKGPGYGLAICYQLISFIQENPETLPFLNNEAAFIALKIGLPLATFVILYGQFRSHLRLSLDQIDNLGVAPDLLVRKIIEGKSLPQLVNIATEMQLIHELLDGWRLFNIWGACRQTLGLSYLTRYLESSLPASTLVNFYALVSPDITDIRQWLQLGLTAVLGTVIAYNHRLKVRLFHSLARTIEDTVDHSLLDQRKRDFVYHNLSYMRLILASITSMLYGVALGLTAFLPIKATVTQPALEIGLGVSTLGLGALFGALQGFRIELVRQIKQQVLADSYRTKFGDSPRLPCAFNPINEIIASLWTTYLATGLATVFDSESDWLVMLGIFVTCFSLVLIEQCIKLPGDTQTQALAQALMRETRIAMPKTSCATLAHCFGPTKSNPLAATHGETTALISPTTTVVVHGEEAPNYHTLKQLTLPRRRLAHLVSLTHSMNGEGCLRPHVSRPAAATPSGLFSPT